MEIQTTRFGAIQIDELDTIHFPAGIPAFEACRQWVLLADSVDRGLAWLQSTTHAEVAVPVVSPRRFVANYRVRVDRSLLTAIQLEHGEDAQVLTLVGRRGDELTLNLKAPLVINLSQRLGRQLVTDDDWSLAYPLVRPVHELRKSA